MPMSNPVEVSQDAADHVQEVNAAHPRSLIPSLLPTGRRTNGAIEVRTSFG